MDYVLEWRDDVLTHGRALVFQVRVFRSAAAIKSFVGARTFDADPPREFRLTLRDDSPVCASVITTRAAIFNWDDRHLALPPCLPASRWASDLARLAALTRIRGGIVACLAQAEELALLSRRDASQIRALFETLVNP